MTEDSVKQLVTHGQVAVKNETIVDLYPELTNKQRYGCPANYKLIPYLVQGVCRHWVWLTGDK